MSHEPVPPNSCPRPVWRGANARRDRAWSSPLNYGRQWGPPRCDARRAAVLVLLYPTPRGWTLPLTVRPQSLSVHPGQVSLPGGELHAGEPSWEGALREFREEMGVDVTHAEPLGRLPSVHVFHSNFWIDPWVAYLPAPPDFLPDPIEVERILELPWSDWPGRVSPEPYGVQRGGWSFGVPSIQRNDATIWGATLTILAQLASQIELAD